MHDFITVLDKGFVQLVDYMGNDDSVLAAARVSTGSASKGYQSDINLINFLMKNGHHSPFEHVVFTFHIKAPLFVARQWFRHRIGSFNEISGRYRELTDEFYIPQNIRVNIKENKQTTVEITNPELLNYTQEQIIKAYEYVYQIYQNLLEHGVAREEARIVLPLGLYTEFYWTVNFRSLMNFLKLRMDEHAQYEIREYAYAIKDIVYDILPISMSAFEKYYYNPGGEQSVG